MIFYTVGSSSGFYHRGSFTIFSIKVSQSNIVLQVVHRGSFFGGPSSGVLHRGSFIGGLSSGVVQHLRWVNLIFDQKFYSSYLFGLYLFICIYSFFIASIYLAITVFTCIHSFFIAPIYSAFIYLHVFILFFIAPIYWVFIYLNVLIVLYIHVLFFL